MSERNTRIRASQIINILPSDLEATVPLGTGMDNYVPSYDEATGKFTWVAQGSGGSLASLSDVELDTGTPINNSILVYDESTGVLKWKSSHKISIDDTFAGNSDLNIPSEKAIKTYINNKLKALSWQEPVLDKDLTSPPSSPSNGDRYIIQSASGFSWDSLNEDCADISDWFDDDAINSVSSQETFDGKTTFKYATNTATSGNKAGRYYGLFYGTTGFNIADNFTAEVKLYCDKIGTLVNDDCVGIVFENGNIRLTVRFASDGLYIFDGSSFNEVGTNLVQQDIWQTWRFIVTGATATGATCDVYLDNVLQASGVDCSAVGTTERVETYLLGYTTNDLIVYIDYIKVGTEFQTPTGDDWDSHVDDITEYNGTEWIYYSVQEGWFTWVEDENKLYYYDGNNWSEFLMITEIKDSDGDTKIQVEESPDEDIIRIDIAGQEKATIDSTNFHIKENIKLEENAIIANKKNVDIDAGTETVDSFSDILGDAVIWHYVVKKGVNLRAGTILAVWDSANNNVEWAEQSTNDIGDTSALTFTVDINTNNVRLLATLATGEINWEVRVIRNMI